VKVSSLTFNTGESQWKIILKKIKHKHRNSFENQKEIKKSKNKIIRE
jgi:hypothetical protein